MELQLEPLALRAQVIQAMESNRPYADRFQVHWRIAENLPDLNVIADQHRLQQVLANYLSNARQVLAHPGDPIQIALAATR